VFPVAQSCKIEARDRTRREQEHREEWPLLVAPAESRHHRPCHEHEPEHEPDREPDLPEATEVDVLVAAVAKVEPRVAEISFHSNSEARGPIHPRLRIRSRRLRGRAEGKA
jgi:hypothetical protein